MFVKGTDVTGPQPAVTESLGVGFGIAPIAGDHHVAAADHLAGLADRQIMAILIDHPHFDIGARQAGGADVVVVKRVIDIGEHPAMQAGDGHRRLALAVDFGQFRTEDVERPACVGVIHRRATVDDGA